MSLIHDMKLWLENRPAKITKVNVKHVMGYPIADRVKSIWCQGREVIKANTLEKWNDKGIFITTIEDPVIEFTIRDIAHKFCQSSRLNNVLCIVVDLGYKIVKMDGSYDLANL